MDELKIDKNILNESFYIWTLLFDNIRLETKSCRILSLMYGTKYDRT